MISTIPPAILFIAGGFLVPFLKGRIKAAYMLLLPVLAFLILLSVDVGTLLDCFVSGLSAHSRPGRPAEPGFRLHIHHHFLHRIPVRPEIGRQPAARCGLRLRGSGPGRDLRRRFVLPVRLLGNHGRGIHLRDPGGTHKRRAGGGVPLHSGPSGRRFVPVWRASFSTSREPGPLNFPTSASRGSTPTSSFSALP